MTTTNATATDLLHFIQDHRPETLTVDLLIGGISVGTFSTEDEMKVGDILSLVRLAASHHGDEAVRVDINPVSADVRKSLGRLIAP